MSLFPIISPAATIPATVVFTDNNVDPANQIAYTFSSQAIGTALPTRKVVVAVGCMPSASAVRTVSTLTVGGISATLVKQVNQASGNYPAIEIWQADVPTGTTADVIVTWNAGCIRCGIGVWAVYDAASAADDTGNSTASPLTNTLNIPANGVAIGYSMSGASATHSWTNLTEKFDETVEGGMTHSGASDAFAAEQTGLAITDTLSAGGEQLMALASWGPV